MKQIFIFFLALTLNHASAEVVVYDKVDERFGGYFLDVDRTAQKLKQEWKRPVSIAEVLAVQKEMRNCLVNESKSFFRNKQSKFLDKCADAGEDKIKAHPVQPEPRDFKVVFDMDETLLTQYHRISVENPRRTTLMAKNRDFTLSEKNGEMIMAPHGVTIRPGVYEILNDLARNPRIAKVYFFSAREDKSAEELRDFILKKAPAVQKKFGGLWARNSLRYDRKVQVPSKDLRIFAPDLKRVLLIDDNPSRVMQKELNFWIPKFNADLWLEAKASHDRDVLYANEVVMERAYKIIAQTAEGRPFTKLSNAFAEENKIDWGREILKGSTLSDEKIEALLAKGIFHQEFFAAETIKP